MKRLAIIVAVVATIGLLWVGGELHRQNCVDAHLTSCSILPWESGSEVAARAACNGLEIGCSSSTSTQPWYAQPKNSWWKQP